MGWVSGLKITNWISNAKFLACQKNLESVYGNNLVKHEKDFNSDRFYGFLQFLMISIFSWRAKIPSFNFNFF